MKEVVIFIVAALVYIVTASLGAIVSSLLFGVQVNFATIALVVVATIISQWFLKVFVFMSKRLSKYLSAKLKENKDVGDKDT